MTKMLEEALTRRMICTAFDPSYPNDKGIPKRILCHALEIGVVELVGIPGFVAWDWRIPEVSSLHFSNPHPPVSNQVSLGQGVQATIFSGWPVVSVVHCLRVSFPTN
jgi:hypothetical protein